MLKFEHPTGYFLTSTHTRKLALMACTHPTSNWWLRLALFLTGQANMQNWFEKGILFNHFLFKRPFWKWYIQIPLHWSWAPRPFSWNPKLVYWMPAAILNFIMTRSDSSVAATFLQCYIFIHFINISIYVWLQTHSWGLHCWSTCSEHCFLYTIYLYFFGTPCALPTRAWHWIHWMTPSSRIESND